MPMTVHRGPCAPRRSLNVSQLCVDQGDQPSSAMAGRRGKAMNSMLSSVTIVSVHSGASTPRIAEAGMSVRYAPGFQPYAVCTSMKPAQLRPSGVWLLYFMSRYALLAGDMTTLAPRETAVLTSESDVVRPQYWTTRLAEWLTAEAPIWCQPITALPRAGTIGWTRFMKVAYWAPVNTFASSPPTCRYGPGVNAASSLRTLLTKVYTTSLDVHSVLNPTSVPV